MELGISWIILIAMLVASFFFSATETALFSLTKIDKRRLTEIHPRLSSWVLKHLEQPSRTLATILFGNLVAHILATSTVTLMILDNFEEQSLGVWMVAYTILFIIFFEIVPKVFAARFNIFFSLVCSIPLRVFAKIFAPVRFFARLIADRILKMMIPHDKEKSADSISDDELKTLVIIGEEEGVFDKQESYMIQNLFELGDRPIREIMTPRTDVKGLDIEDSSEERLDTMKEHHFSHLPVFEESLDNILGVVSVQDYLLSEKRDIHKCLHQPLFIPESKKIDEVLEDFRQKSENFAVCVDEHGGTAGIVTLEDVLEEIFGEYHDEYAKVQHPIRRLGRYNYIVEAKISLTDFNEFFDSNLRAEEATTVGGFILEQIGDLPHRGQTLKVEDLEIRILKVIRRRIRSLQVKKHL